MVRAGELNSGSGVEPFSEVPKRGVKRGQEPLERYTRARKKKRAGSST